MKLQQMLNRHRDGVLGRWKELVFATYPKDSSGFMADNPDRFANPVGHATAEGLASIYDTPWPPGERLGIWRTNWT